VNRRCHRRSAQPVRTLLLLNDQAGTVAARRRASEPADVARAFAEAGFDAELVAAQPSELAAALRAVAARQPEALFIGGGDGTVSAAAGILAGTGIALGVLPLGTMNHFARDLGLPADWREAIAALKTARAVNIDVGEVNGHVFINNCSLGLYAEAVRRRNALRRQRAMGKWRAMVVASWAVFRRLRRMCLEVQTADRTTHLHTPLIVISNNRYTGHVLDGSVRERLDEGRLWLHTTRAHRHGHVVRLAWQALRRRLDDVDHLDVWPLTTATISAPAGVDLPVAADGELLALRPPLLFRIRPGALRVLAPVGEPR
jgi:diacylglycerol kinase family enzyme